MLFVNEFAPAVYRSEFIHDDKVRSLFNPCGSLFIVVVILYF